MFVFIEVVLWLSPLTMWARVVSQFTPCAICGGERAGFSPGTSVFVCHSHSTNASYTYTLLLSGQAAEVSERFKKQRSFRI